MPKKIHVVESAVDRKIRLANDKKLSDLRIFISSENSDIRSKSKELLAFSERTRRLTIFDMVLQVVDGIADVGEDNVDKIKGPTPEASKYITNIIKLKEEILSLEGDRTTVTVSNKEKISKCWIEIKSLQDKFEVALRAVFDAVEALLNGLLLNTDVITSYSESLELCYKHNLITKSQYNVFKMLGHIRNLVTHNSTTYVMMRTIDTDHLYLFKACILEARTSLVNVSIKHRTRLFAFGSYIRAQQKLEAGVSLSERDVDICHVWFSKMVLTDIINKITHIKELYSSDELTKSYIKKKL